MQKQGYSAGAVKFSFWFAEFRKMVSLLQSGKTIQEIKTLAEKENIFSAATSMRSRQILTTVSARVKSLSDSYIDVFTKSVLETQKLIVLISIMKTDSLFFSFMNDVYREKLIISDMQLTDSDMRIFFLNKQRESEKVAGWTDITLDRLRRTYKKYLAEAGISGSSAGDRMIVKPILDNHLESLLASEKSNQLLKILSGTR